MSIEEIGLQRVSQLCSLLKGEEESPAVEWFTKLTQELSDVDPITAYGFLDKKEEAESKNTLPKLPKLFKTLQECLLNQRWPEALQMLEKLFIIPNGTDQTIWKVGSDLMSLEGDRNRDLLQQLYLKLKKTSQMNNKEVIMEFVQYLLTIGEKEAMSVMQEHVPKPRQKAQPSYSDEFWKTIHTAYLGLMWYVEWKNCLQILEDGKSDLQDSHRFDSELIEMRLSSSSSKATKCFEQLHGQKGVWDIFVKKHVELLIDDNKHDVAKAVLDDNCLTNPENLNAHKYLYWFLISNKGTESQIIECLKKIADVSPSDKLVQDLIERLHTDNTVEAVKYLFKLLDYPVWQFEREPWQKFSKCLQSLLIQRSDDHEAKQAICGCWSVRKSWWPTFHFTAYIFREGESVESLNFHKVTVAALLIGKDHHTVTECSELLEEKERTKLFKLLKGYNVSVT